MIDFLISFFGAGAGAALLGFLARDWFAVRIKNAIEKEAYIQRSAHELKRQACLDALDVVDAAMSQLEWKDDKGNVLPVAKQELNIDSARGAFNQLALTCANPEIVEKYVEALGIRTPDEPPITSRGDLIVDLRNKMRTELGFGEPLDFDRRKAWIGNLDGAT